MRFVGHALPESVPILVGGKCIIPPLSVKGKTTAVEVKELDSGSPF